MGWRGSTALWGEFIAGIFVLTGAIGFGMALTQESKCILYHMKEQKQMLFYIEREIMFLHRPMQEIFWNIAERLQKPYDTFLLHVAEKMEDGSGRNLITVWEAEIEELYKKKGYPKTTFFYLRQMTRCFCCEEDVMQKEAFSIVSHELEEELERMKKDKKEKDRLIRTLSVLAGILCIVIFL